VSEESDQALLQEAVDGVLSLVVEGREDEAVEKMVDFRSRGQVTRDVLIRTIISTGQYLQSEKVTRPALRAFERVKQSAKPDGLYYYDVANGYQILYERGSGEKGESAFEMGDEVNAAAKYFARANFPQAHTNLGNLLDSVGRPLEALKAYQAALDLDPEFGMAWGNWGMTLEHLASSGQYSGGLLFHAYRLLQEALDRPTSIFEIGGPDAYATFAEIHDRIEAHFVENGQGELLNSDHRHAARDDSAESPFVRFYTALCVKRDLYLNLHLVDPHAAASVGDTYLPTFISSTKAPESEFRELALRLNEIHETFATARYLFARSQFIEDDTRTISEQTTLVNTLDYAASNLYVGLLKSAYKEAFSALDKLAVLINHYLRIGHDENNVYYGNVWFEPGTEGASRRIADAVRASGYRLLGTYLLCLELRGSRYSSLRNAMTHRYVRVFRYGTVAKGGYDFDRLVDLTGEVLFKVKCAIIYVSQFITAEEQRKHKGSVVGTLPAWTNQNLDLWGGD
jgi:tetratricopeptide (TPR) repeat protein